MITKRILELRKQRAELMEENRQAVVVAEGESLPPEVMEAVNENFATIDNIDLELKALERLERETGEERKVLRGRVADEGEAQPAPTEQRPFRSLAEQLVAVARSSRNDGFVDPRLHQVAATGLSESVPSEGGFLVQTDFTQEILRRTYETGSILARVRRLPISSGSNGTKINAIDETSRASGSRWGGVIGYWLAEAAVKTASKPKFRQIELNLNKIAALVYATDESLQDAMQLETIIMEAVPQELRFQVEEAVVRGTGAGQPLGVLNSPCLITVTKETGQPATTIRFENLVRMYARTWAPGRSQMVWNYNQDIEPQLFTMGITLGTGGAPVWLPPGGLSGSPYSSLFGNSMMPTEYNSTLGTVGDILAAQWPEYVLAEKGGVQMASSIHVNFLYDESVFRFVYRVDGQPLWKAALTPAQGTNTVSPFVVLETRS